MPLTLEEFVKQLEDSGILAGDTLKEFLPPISQPKDAEELTRELVRRKKLTPYQATAVFQGNARSLRFDNYYLLDKLGQGGMGMVFKAEHRTLKRIVALKVLPPSATRSPDAVKRFHREVQAAARLTHPNIVAAFDAGEANKVHFLVMEYVEGSDLSQVVKKQGPLPVEQAVQCIWQAAQGLAAAHQAGIIHRDIKPANLLLDKQGVVKVLDMGLARLEEAGDAGVAGTLTQTGAIMGTVDFMSPEQALNTKYADARSDIYSLGISLYYLLTGRSAYTGDSLMEKLLAHRERPIPELRTLCPAAPPALEAVFRRMVAKKVEERYQTMTEVLHALETCLATAATPNDTGLDKWATAPEQNSELLSFLQQQVEPTLAGTFASAPVSASGKTSADTSAEVRGTTSKTIPRSVSASPPAAGVPSTRPANRRFLTLVAGAVCSVLLLGMWFGIRRPKSHSPEKSSVAAARPTKKAISTAAESSAGSTIPLPAKVPFTAEQGEQHQLAWAEYLGVPVEYTSKLGTTFRLIPPGEFKMGLDQNQLDSFLRLVGKNGGYLHRGLKSAAPQHPVRLTRASYFATREVRYGDFVQLLKRPPGNVTRNQDIPDSHPVQSNASWMDAVEFCNALSLFEDLQPCYFIQAGNVQWLPDADGYRLPTEAEWEFACRGGTKTTWFYKFDPMDHERNAGYGHDLHAHYARDSDPVGSMQPNPFGLYEMYAISDEWCWDWFDDNTYAARSRTRPVDDPRGPETGQMRVKRGGSSFSGGGGDLGSINSVVRGFGNPQDAGGYSGLGRVVRSVPRAGPPTKGGSN